MKKIHNLDSLEKEILGQKLRIKEAEEKLQNNMHHLADNFPGYVSRSLSCKKEKKSFLSSLMENEHVHSFVSGLAEKTANKTGELVEKWFEKLFKKN